MIIPFVLLVIPACAGFKLIILVPAMPGYRPVVVSQQFLYFLPLPQGQ